MKAAQAKIQNSKFKLHNPFGFTLIELLVSISIIAIISAVGAVMYTQAQKSARDGKRIGDLEEIQKALEQYYAVNQAYPAEANYSTALNSYFANATTPRDPLNTGSNVYTYRDCAGNTGRYNICAVLESCGTKCNLTAVPATTAGCTAAPLPAAGPPNTVLCRSNISTN
jgi:prepilin-type N-terminal cleavage/methylation domain-containing protein